MTTAPPIIPSRPHEAREFSDWHERAIEHLIVHSGNTVEREPLILGKTPDLLVKPQNGSPFIVECIACLQDQTHAADLAGRGRHTCDGNIRDLTRISTRVWTTRQPSIATSPRPCRTSSRSTTQPA